jgi:hypothetical protein
MRMAGADDGFYHYCGDGQIGDMTFARGNLAIRSHCENGKLLLLFETGRDRFRRFVGPKLQKEDNGPGRETPRWYHFQTTPLTGVVFERLTEQKGLREGLRFLSSRIEP